MITNIVRKAIKPTSDINAFCFFYNGVFENMLGHIPELKLYGDVTQPFNRWKKCGAGDEKHISHIKLEQIPLNDIPIDLVICNKRDANFSLVKATANHLKVPLLLIDHSGPDSSVSDVELSDIYRMHENDFAVGTNKAAARYNREQEYINYYMSLPNYTDERINKYLISGDFSQNDVLIVSEVIQDLGSGYKLIGNMAGLKAQNLAFYEEIEETFLQSEIFINLPTSNTVSYDLLIAMACGCGIVTSKPAAVTNVIQNGVNGIVVDNVEDIAEACKDLISNKTKLKSFTDYNLDIIKNDYSKELFVNRWSDKLHTIKKEVFIP